MALVVRDVDDAAGRGRLPDVVDALGSAIDLAQDRIERVPERLVDRVALRGTHLVEVGLDALACGRPFRFAAGLQVAGDLLAGEDGFGDFVVNRHGGSDRPRVR
jgi:hypothetical protein